MASIGLDTAQIDASSKHGRNIGSPQTMQCELLAFIPFQTAFAASTVQSSVLGNMFECQQELRIGVQISGAEDERLVGVLLLPFLDRHQHVLRQRNIPLLPSLHREVPLRLPSHAQRFVLPIHVTILNAIPGRGDRISAPTKYTCAYKDSPRPIKRGSVQENTHPARILRSGVSAESA